MVTDDFLMIHRYAVFQIFHLSSRPEMYSAGLLHRVLKSSGTNGNPPLPPLVLQSYVSPSSFFSCVSQSY